jgi:hypothetical protein
VTRVELTEHRPAVRRWIKALRSSRYTQGFGALATPPLTASGPNRYCCLGVAEDVRGCTWTWLPKLDHVPRLLPAVDGQPLEGTSGGSLSYDTAAWLGVTTPDPHVAVPPDYVVTDTLVHGGVRPLSRLNDSVKLPLVNIAELVERQPFDWDGSWNQAHATFQRWLGEPRR